MRIGVKSALQLLLLLYLHFQQHGAVWERVLMTIKIHLDVLIFGVTFKPYCIASIKVKVQRTFKQRHPQWFGMVTPNKNYTTLGAMPLYITSLKLLQKIDSLFVSERVLGVSGELCLLGLIFFENNILDLRLWLHLLRLLLPFRFTNLLDVKRITLGLWLLLVVVVCLVLLRVWFEVVFLLPVLLFFMLRSFDRTTLFLDNIVFAVILWIVVLVFIRLRPVIMVIRLNLAIIQDLLPLWSDPLLFDLRHAVTNCVSKHLVIHADWDFQGLLNHIVSILIFNQVGKLIWVAYLLNHLESSRCVTFLEADLNYIRWILLHAKLAKFGLQWPKNDFTCLWLVFYNLSNRVVSKRMADKLHDVPLNSVHQTLLLINILSFRDQNLDDTETVPVYAEINHMLKNLI